MKKSLLMLSTALPLVLVPTLASAQSDSISNFFDRLTSVGKPKTDPKDAERVDGALETAISRPGQVVAWDNPVSGNSGTVVVTGSLKNSYGNDCRSYRRTTTSGQIETLYEGVVCNQVIFGWTIDSEKKVSTQTASQQTKTTTPPTTQPVPQAYSQPPPSAPPPPQSDPEVLETQTLLAQLGYDPGPADGQYGRKTRTAIEEYQRSNFLSVDGQVSSTLLLDLIGAVAAKDKKSETTFVAVPPPSPPAPIATETAVSTPQMAAVLPVATRDYCGPAGDEWKQKFVSFVVADEALGPFTEACKAHDACYVESSQKIVASMESRYQMTVSSTGLLDKYKPEAKALFETEKLNCDGKFFAEIKQACLDEPLIRKLILVGPIVTTEPGCDTKAALYFSGVTSRWGNSAFDGALASALQSPRPHGEEQTQTQVSSIDSQHSVDTASNLQEIESISADRIIILDHDYRTSIIEKNVDEQFDPGTFTQLMTVLIVFQELKAGRLNLSDTFPVSEKAWRTGGSKTFVRVGTRVKVSDLLRGVIVQSGNDAAIVLAEGLAKTESAFVGRMNKVVRELGLSATTYRNATGFSHPEQLTTAQDLATIASYLIREYPDLYRFFSEKTFTYGKRLDGKPITQSNRNPLLYQDVGADGIKAADSKTGGFGIVASVLKSDKRIIIIGSGFPDVRKRSSDSRLLVDFGYRKIENRTPDELIALEKAEQERIALEKAEQERIAREKAEQERIVREKAEQERIVREKAEQELLARLASNAERERKAQENKDFIESARLSKLTRESAASVLSKFNFGGLRETFFVWGHTNLDSWTPSQVKTGLSEIKALLASSDAELGGFENRNWPGMHYWGHYLGARRLFQSKLVDVELIVRQSHMSGRTRLQRMHMYVSAKKDLGKFCPPEFVRSLAPPIQNPARREGRLECKVNLGKWVFDSVTGIKGPEGRKQVEYTIKIQPNEAGIRLNVAGKTKALSAVFEQYDDGWRLTQR